MNRDALKASLIAHEGEKPLLYKDTENHTTGAIGHNFDQPMPKKLMELILDFDVGIAVEELDRAFSGWRNHSEARQTVLGELCFAMGAPVLAQFTRFWFAMQQKDYTTASQELLSSKWATQVGQRAETLAKRLREDLLS